MLAFIYCDCPKYRNISTDGYTFRGKNSVSLKFCLLFIGDKLVKEELAPFMSRSHFEELSSEEANRKPQSLFLKPFVK